MINNWIPKKKIVQSVGVALFLSFSLYMAGLFLVTSKIKQVENLYRDTESETSKEERRWALKAILTSNAKDIKILRDFFIQKGDEVKFIEQIEYVARKSGIQFEIRSIDLKTKTDSSFKEDVTIKLDISGDWQSVVSFLDSLGKLTFGVVVENLDLDTSISGQWKGSVSLVVFREK